ncbi:hypothetical protein BDW71DRAFT_212594 [Aspergillus fruticulosus]
MKIQSLIEKREQPPEARVPRIKTIILYSLSIFGAFHLSFYLRPPTGFVIFKGEIERANDRDQTDIYPDTDYPLRPALEPWDISTSYPYPKTLSKIVTEGTWLRIATHPILPEIVFDMLGDLYCMSIPEDNHKGKSSPQIAHSILTGIPYDKEAEFSSDGTQLVFISDAGFGVDNIWTMPYTTCSEMGTQSPEVARASTVQQTNSTFRFFSSPARDMGGPYQNQDTKTTQIPKTGGKRIIQRTLPPSWTPERYYESQLGAEQARYTPSGEGIVFSRNVKDDMTGKFSYNKDIHAGINAAYLLNTTTSQITELVEAAASTPNQPARPGGANMPRLSRDGRTLAFVRRVDEKEVLALKDMSSGTVHYVWDGLDYDLSTIPAFMGAYPNYGWTGNDSAIVIWAQGVGNPEILHFEARIELALGETRYSKTNITDNELAGFRQIRALRGLRSDYPGERIVFEAAGDNYLAYVGSDTVQGIAKPDDSVSCYAPSFIRGSEYILQACWDDRNLTSFYLVDLSGGNAIIPLQGLPRGRYLSPVSDGRFIAYVRTGNDYMFGDIEETFGAGVWVGEVQLPRNHSTVGSMQSLRRLDGVDSSFETKLTLRDDGTVLIDNPTSVLEYSMRTGVLTVRARGKTSVEMATVPAGNGLIALRDFQHIWLTKIKPKASIWSKPGDPRTPEDLLRLSDIGGHDVTFSGNGRRVFWLLGPVLYYAEAGQIMQSCSGKSLESRDTGGCAKQYIETQTLNVTQQMAVPAPEPLVILNASLISMSLKDPELVTNATIIIQSGQITAEGAGSDISLPSTPYKTLQVNGGAVLPGFIDIHGHWGGFLSPYPAQSWEMETFIGYGVTTIHNPASRNVAGHIERHLIDKGRMYGPRIFHTGDVLYGSTQPSVYTEINSLADARDALLRLSTEGGEGFSFSAKNYQLPARSARQRLLLAAAELNMLVVPEGGWSFDWGLTYFIDGYTSHEHPSPIPTLYEDVLSLIAASGSSYTPLAVMNYGGIFGQHWIHQNEDIVGNEKLRQFVKHDILESLTEVTKAPKSSYLFFNTTRSTASLAVRGVRTNIGAHGEQPIGYLYHSEMRMMGVGGQRAYDVLRAATMGNAVSLGVQSSIGSVEEGKLADLVIYPGGCDTVEKVWEGSMHMKYVVRGGTLFDVEDGLVEVWPREGRRQVKARLNAEEEI